MKFAFVAAKPSQNTECYLEFAFRLTDLQPAFQRSPSHKIDAATTTSIVLEKMVKLDSTKHHGTSVPKVLQLVMLLCMGIMLKSVALMLQASDYDGGLSESHRGMHHEALYASDSDTVVLPHDKVKIPKEVIVKHLPDDKVVVNRRKLLEIEEYYTKYDQKNDYATIYEAHLPEPAQEVGVCRIGSKIYYFGGYNETLFADFTVVVAATVALGTNRMYVYDMEDMSVTQGPNLPTIGNHLGCAQSDEGIIHLTGGYRQDAPDGKEKAYRRHWVLDTNVPLSEAKWGKGADMPLPRGAHGCNFLRDGKMYCLGGGAHQWGPFGNDLMIYDPKTDSWELGPPMHDPRDHVMDFATLWDGNALFVIGGRAHITEYPAEHKHPYFWTSAYSAEIYDLRTKKWRMVRAPQTPREATMLVSYNRHGDDAEPTVLVVGGQRFFGYSGSVINTLDEFDPNTGLYHCHDPLPFPVFGAAVGVWKDKMHIVGGGEWMGISSTRRVVVLDLKKMPAPRNCYYKEEPIFDEWHRTYNLDPPYPGVYNTTNHMKHHVPMQYKYHEHLFKDVMMGLPGKHGKPGKPGKRKR
jgi:N-acetylneuraminic acid mutarotase